MVEARSNLRRYVLRTDLVRKVRNRLRKLVRQATRSAFTDAAQLLGHREARMVVDVGANIGYVSRSFLQRFPHAIVWSFEPTPETYSALDVYLRDEARSRRSQLAVSDADGSAVLHVDNHVHGGGSNSLLPHSARFNIAHPEARYVPVEVETVRLDTFADREGIDHIDVLKLDVEGAEVTVLSGASGLLERSAIDVIISEIRIIRDYEGQPLLADLEAFLNGYGYQLFNIYGFVESSIGQALYGDALFLSTAFRRELETIRGRAATGWAPVGDDLERS